MSEQQQRKQSLQLKPTIVIIDGKLSSRGVAVAAGILVIHQRNMQHATYEQFRNGKQPSAHCRRVLQDSLALETMIIISIDLIPRKSLLISTAKSRMLFPSKLPLASTGDHKQSSKNNGEYGTLVHSTAITINIA
eukprot:scaffold75171_cov78-Cyclotella_meneghiniana.AAC.2